MRDWIGPGVLPKGGMMTVGADPKAGKSMFAMELGRALATGTTPFSCPSFYVPESTRVLYVDAEVGERGLQNRGRKMYTEDLDLLTKNFWYVSQDPELTLNTPAGIKRLATYVEEIRPGVLILDPIGRLHGYDENDNSQIGALFHTFDTLLRRHREDDLALVLIHHMRKKGGNSEGAIDPLSPHNFRGSSRFSADPDTLVMLNRMDSYRSKTGDKAWRIASRWITRQGESPDDTVFTVNDRGDLRVRYSGAMGPPPKLDPVIKKQNVPAEQMRLTPAEPDKEDAPPWDGFIAGNEAPSRKR